MTACNLLAVTGTAAYNGLVTALERSLVNRGNVPMLVGVLAVVEKSADTPMAVGCVLPVSEKLPPVNSLVVLWLFQWEGKSDPSW